MRNSVIAIPATLAAIMLLAACDPDEATSNSAPSGGLTPADVEGQLNALSQDLARILAVVEPLEGDPESQTRRVLEDDRLRNLLGDHVKEIEAVAASLQSMSAEERAAFSNKIRPAMQSLEFRMEEICSCGPAAEDAFAPLFVAAQEALRASL